MNTKQVKMVAEMVGQKAEVRLELASALGDNDTSEALARLAEYYALDAEALGMKYDSGSGAYVATVNATPADCMPFANYAKAHGISLTIL